MIEHELHEMMSVRLFKSHSRSSDHLLFDFVDESNVHCDVKLQSKEFRFVFITLNWHTLSSGWASPIDNKTHFDKLYNKFMEDVVKVNQ
jgi:hypothetical protein